MSRLSLKICAVLFLVTLISGSAHALEKIYITRHAEKAEGWPKERALSSLHPLSEMGAQRARQLADHLGQAGIAAVYASPTTRTLHTGLPLANQAGVPLVADMRTISEGKLPAFLDALKKSHADDSAILIVGHSNTVPLLLKALGATNACYESLGLVSGASGLLVEGYDGLWTVDLDIDGCAGLGRSELSTGD